jgi:hypothetical protein
MIQCLLSNYGKWVAEEVEQQNTAGERSGQGGEGRARLITVNWKTRGN